MTVSHRKIVEIVRDIRAALNGETARLREELSYRQEADAYLQERAEASVARARRAIRKARDEALDEAQDEARRVSWEAADRDSERERLIRDLGRARYSGSEYEEQRIIDKLKRI